MVCGMWQLLSPDQRRVERRAPHPLKDSPHCLCPHTVQLTITAHYHPVCTFFAPIHPLPIQPLPPLDKRAAHWIPILTLGARAARCRVVERRTERREQRGRRGGVDVAAGKSGGSAGDCAEGKS